MIALFAHGAVLRRSNKTASHQKTNYFYLLCNPLARTAYVLVIEAQLPPPTTNSIILETRSGNKSLEPIINIIQGCARMEHKYQKLVYEKYFGFALKIVFRYIYRYEKAVDIANDGFVKLFRSFDSFVSGSDEDAEKILMGYIKKIMINASIDELRKNKMTPEIGGIPEDVWDMNSKTDEADQMMIYKDLILLIKQLPPQYRVVFNMYVIDGYNHLEIAEIMKISVGTSKSSLSRARTLLQKSIKQIEDSIACNM